MKLYRLKDEVKKYITNPDYFTIEEDREHWYNEFGIGLKALEEVEKRVQLCWHENDRRFIDNSEGRIFTEEELLLCEQALNGELFTIQEMADYFTWYKHEYFSGRFKNLVPTTQHVSKWLKEREQ